MTITQRGPNSWQIKVSGGTDATGKRLRPTKTIRGTYEDAVREEMRLTLQVADTLPAEFAANATVTTLLDAWLPIHNRISESTRYDYRLVIDKHIIPNIGDMPLHKVKPFTLDRFYQQLADDGLGPDRIRRVHSILSGAFKKAVKWEWIGRSPVRDAEQPPAPIRDVEAPTPAQYRQLTKTADDTLLLAAVAIHLAGNVGSRRGEICGLQWRDFDLERGTVQVRRTVSVVPGVGDVVKPIKGNPRLRLERKPLDPATIDLLRLWDIATADERALGFNPDGWLFVAPAKGGFYRPDCMGRLFSKIAKQAGLPGLHMHQLRHYVVTQLLDAGIDVSVVSRRVGHSRTSTTTDVYGHGVAAAAVDAAKAMARINRGD